MNETIKNMFLKGWQVIRDLMAMPHMQWVVAVREQDGLQLTSIVQKVACMDVGQLYPVFLPRAKIQTEGNN